MLQETETKTRHTLIKLLLRYDMTSLTDNHTDSILSHYPLSAPQIPGRPVQI